MKKYDVQMHGGRRHYVFVPDEVDEKELTLEDFAIAVAVATRKAFVGAAAAVLECKEEPTSEDIIL